MCIRDRITFDIVKEACRFVNADKVIDKLPNKYNEIVRERGKNFSSGERQLISFARVVSHKPNIMILDEATSNIDTETEALIQDSLKKMMKDVYKRQVSNVPSLLLLQCPSVLCLL